jgi:hypothetical protein
MTPAGDDSGDQLSHVSISEARFLPARSKLEAVTRISATTHSPPETLGPGSKERKSVLVNLATGLEIEVNTKADKPALGEQIACGLHMVWGADCWSSGQTITLIGLNRLLEGAEREVKHREVQEPAVVTFVPARSKLEAVSRISALTDAPAETLGPGSKERKSALVNLASGLGLTIDARKNKPEVGAQIASALGATWDGGCWSTGQTITLIGLNRLLEAGQREVERLHGSLLRGLFRTAREEAAAILEALALVIPRQMEGRSCVRQMLEAEYSQWAQDEWAAFFFEFVGLPALVNAFSGGPVSFENTIFDYGLNQVWDFKLHAAVSGAAPLNAMHAIDACLAAGRGLGFIVLSGETKYDDGEFRQWLRELRAAQGKKAALRNAPPSYVRKSKARFTPTKLEVFYFADAEALEGARNTGVLTVMNQGRQSSGASRRPKYGLNLAKARAAGLVLATRVLDQ